MDAQTLNALKDVAGVPSHPAIFMILGIVTFALHILAVQVMLGASGLTIWGALSKNPHHRRLAQTMLNTAKIAVSVAIVLGVAPLLFVQVIYDPFWYTSNVLSAWWVIGFILILIVAYLLMYIFYGRNHNLATQKTSCPGSMLLSLALLLVVGFIMHVLTQQMLSPDQWMEWYAPNGVIDASGRGVHDYNLLRFGFFISLSLVVIGSWLIAYRRYIQQKPDASEHGDYIAWLQPIAARLSIAGAVISLLFGLGWLTTLPEHHAGHVPAALSLLAILAIWLVAAIPTVFRTKLDGIGLGYGLMGLTLVATLLVAIAREAFRWNILFDGFGYNALDYKINMDWYSTGLFFFTFLVVGGITLAYFISVAWQAGQSKGIYTPSPAIDRLGTISMTLIVLWIIHFFALGFWVWLA